MDSIFRRWTTKSHATDEEAAPSSLDTHEKGGEPHEFASSSNQSNDTYSNQHEERQDELAGADAEWVFIDEPVGFFFPKIRKQRQLLELDQVHHVLHYARYRHAMRIHDISLVTSVEEVTADGRRQWWMTVQDPSTLQVWVVHFPSRVRLQVWVDLLRSVVRATGGRAIVSDVVRATEFDRQRRRSSACIAIVRHLEEAAGGIWGPEARVNEGIRGCRDVAIAVS